MMKTDINEKQHLPIVIIIFHDNRKNHDNQNNNNNNKITLMVKLKFVSPLLNIIRISQPRNFRHQTST